MGELDTQKTEDLAEGQEPEVKEEGQEPEKETTEPEAEPKTFDEEYVKGLRRENAKHRRELRDLENSVPGLVQGEVKRILSGQGQVDPRTGQPAGQPAAGQPDQGKVFDPRVDDMLLSNKLTEIKADPYFKELFTETDEEGRTFEEKLLEKAVELSWPIGELDALVFKMEKSKLLGGVKQKGIDEAYKSMGTKAEGSADKGVSSGKSAQEGEVKTIDDAIEKTKKELGVSNISDSLKGR